MGERLAGRVVLITGAASGIGRATALAAAQEGADIAALDIDEAGLITLADEVAAIGTRWVARTADVADAVAVTSAVDELVGELGSLHVVFANAGILMQATKITQLDLDDWHRVLGVNLGGVLHTFKAAVPHLTSGGLLLACGSSLAIRPNIGLLPYVAAKAGVHAMSRALALELAPQGIRVNVLAPGLTETAMTLGVPGHIDRNLPSVPLGIVAQPEDAAALAVHLMSDDARSITGAVFTVDGGRTAG